MGRLLSIRGMRGTIERPIIARIGRLARAHEAGPASLRLPALAGFVFAIVCGGCRPLPPGSLEQVHARPLGSRRGHAYLVRGWRDLYSGGMDQLAGELRHAGIHAAVFREEQWGPLGDSIARTYGGAGNHGPLVLIGFSYGADDVIWIAKRLEHRGIPVDLLITIDPVTPPPVPKNVRVCYDYFQTNGVWDVFPWLRGVPLRSDGAAHPINVDLRARRRDLLEPDTAHSNIAANPRLHREIVKRVLEAFQ